MASHKKNPLSNEADSSRTNESPTQAHAEADRGRLAEKPTDIPARGWWDILRRTVKQLSEDNLSIVAAGMAFYAFTAMVPALAATIAIYALLNDPTTVANQIESMAHILPEQTRPILHDQLVRLTTDNQSAGWSAALGIGIAVFGAMKAMIALMTGLNIAYHESERRGFILLYGSALLLTITGIIGVILAVTLIAVIPSVLRVMGIDGAGQTAFSILRWPLLAALFAFALAVVYRYAACRDKPQWRWVSWGAGAATLLWLLGSAGFSYYLARFDDFEGTYGSLGAIVALLLWLFLTAFVVLLGAELDAEMERQTVKDTTVGPEEPMGQRGAHAADNLGPSPGNPKHA
jgi:membrane protein